MDGVELIPASAWVQAVFVCLFIAFSVYVLSWMSKSKREEQQYQAEQSKQNQEFQAKESEKWQKFIDQVDDKWRAFNKEQRIENNCSMSEVKGSLQDVATVMQALVSEVKEMRSDTTMFLGSFAQHDAQAREILNEVKKPTPTRSRAKKPVEVDVNSN